MTVHSSQQSRNFFFVIQDGKIIHNSFDYPFVDEPVVDLGSEVFYATLKNSGKKCKIVDIRKSYCFESPYDYENLPLMHWEYHIL